MAFCFPAYRCSNGEWSNGVNGAMDFSEYKVRFSKRFLYRGILISRADILLKQVHRGRRRKTSTLKLQRKRERIAERTRAKEMQTTAIPLCLRSINFAPNYTATISKQIFAFAAIIYQATPPTEHFPKKSDDEFSVANIGGLAREGRCHQNKITGKLRRVLCNFRSSNNRGTLFLTHIKTQCAGLLPELI